MPRYADELSAAIDVPVEFWEKNTMLHITDMQGRLIRQHEISAGTDQLDVHLNEVENGIYLFSFLSDGIRQFKKVVVQK